MKFIKIDNDIYNFSKILKFKFENDKLYLDKEEYNCTKDEFITLTSFLGDNNKFFQDIRHTNKETEEEKLNLMEELYKRY